MSVLRSRPAKVWTWVLHSQIHLGSYSSSEDMGLSRKAGQGLCRVLAAIFSMHVSWSSLHFPSKQCYAVPVRHPLEKLTLLNAGLCWAGGNRQSVVCTVRRAGCASFPEGTAFGQESTVCLNEHVLALIRLEFERKPKLSIAEKDDFDFHFETSFLSALAYKTLI